MAEFNTLNIKSIQRETVQSISVIFIIPSYLKESYTFIAGQYVTLKTTINNKEVRRDYSICASPKSGELRVAIKAVKDGLFSNFANSKLEIGDTLEVSTPQGRFTFVPDNTKTRTIAAFAAGSGITPILSIAKSILEDEINSKFVLVYGNKNLEETIFLNELLELQKTYTSRFTIQFVYSQVKTDNALFGRIEESTMHLILKQKVIAINFDAFYICGPEVMINTVKETLINEGVNSNIIHFELFTAPTALTDITKIDSNGETKITIIVDDEEETFTMSQEKTILEAAINKDIDAPYSCQGGICSSCIARVKKGTARMRQNSILTDTEVAEGLIITCQAQPTSPELVIDYDDV